MNEREQMEQQIAEIAQNKQQILDEMEFAKTRETEINEETARMQETLETQNKREAEISDELSFSSRSFFFSSFQKETGMSPTKYRQLYTKS